MAALLDAVWPAEVLRVAAAEGHPFERVTGDFSATQVLEGAAGRSTAFERGLAERATRVSTDAATSLVHEIERGRRRPATSNLRELERRALSAT